MFILASPPFALALPVLVAASAVPRNNGSSSQCNTSNLQCCSSVQSATSSPVATILGLLGIAVGSVTGFVGVNCSPIQVIGVGGTSCTGKPVCCTNNTFNGLITLGCTPINISL